MAAEYPLSLVIKAVDKATAPLREINKKLTAFTAPVRKLNNSFKALSDEAGIPRLAKGLRGVGHSVGKVGEEALGLGLKLAGMATAAGVGLYAIIHGAMEAGDKLGMMAERVGLTVDTYAQLQFAAAQADVEQEAFNSAMDQFNKRLGESKAGGGELLGFLQKVAPGLADQVQGAKSTEAALTLMTDAFEKVTDPGKRAAMAAAAFGKSGLQMGQFLGQGNKALKEQKARYAELAGSQEQFAKGADVLDMALRETETGFLGLRNAAAGELFPALTELAKALTGVLAGNRGQLKEWAKETGAALSAWVKGGGVPRLVETLKNLAQSIGRVVDMVGGLKGVLVGVGFVMAAPLLASVVSLSASLWQLGSAVIPMLVRAGMMLWPVLVQLSAAIAPMAVTIAPFVAAAAGLAAAGYAIYKNWSVLMEGFTSWSGYLNVFRAQVEMLLHPLEALRTAGQWWGKELGITGGPARPSLGAASAAPGVGGAARGGEAKVTVDFNNLPAGARVTQEPGATADLDLSMGYAMLSG